MFRDKVIIDKYHVFLVYRYMRFLSFCNRHIQKLHKVEFSGTSKLNLVLLENVRIFQLPTSFCLYSLGHAGPIFMFSLGATQLLYMNLPDVVKEISICSSLDFGKPSYQRKDCGPLLGLGILTSNGALWAHQRKILAPEFYMDKFKVCFQHEIPIFFFYNN